MIRCDYKFDIEISIVYIRIAKYEQLAAVRFGSLNTNFYAQYSNRLVFNENNS